MKVQNSETPKDCVIQKNNAQIRPSLVQLNDDQLASDSAAQEKDEYPAKKGVKTSFVANTNIKSTISSTTNMVDDGRPTEAPQHGKKWVKVIKTE